MSGVTFQILLAGGEKVTHLAPVFNGLNANSFVGAAIGTPSPDRILVAVVSSGQATPPTGVTIDGTAMNSRVNASNHARIFTLAWPSNTTATVALTGSSGTSTNSIELYAMTGASGETPFATATGAGSGSLNVPANGVCVGGAWGSGATGGVWTGLSTRDYLSTTASEVMTAAHQEFSAAQTSLAVSVTLSGTKDLALASWGP